MNDTCLVAGRVIDLADLERTVERSGPGMLAGCGAAFGLDPPGGGVALVAVQEVDTAVAADLDRAIEAARNAVTRAHAVGLAGLVLVEAGTLPQTAPGPQRRAAVRAAYEAAALPAVAAWSPPATSQEPAAGPAGASEFPLSASQAGLWFVNERAGGGQALNLSVALEIAGGLDAGAFRRAWEQLTARHEALRTRFGQRRGIPYQQVLPQRDIDFEHHDVPGRPEHEVRAALQAEANRPFDLTSDPLLRVRVYGFHAARSWVLVCLHQMITDVWSLSMLLHELGEVYEAVLGAREVSLPRLGASYADYVAWQSEWLQGTTAAGQLDRWARQLTPEPPPLELPGDRPRPAVLTERGGAAGLVLPGALSSAVRAFCAQHHVTTSVLLTTAFQLLLHHYTGQDRIVVGVATQAPGRPEFARLAGSFVNPVPVDLDLTGDVTFSQLLARAGDVTRAALRGSLVPFARIAGRARGHREASRSPLFQAMYVHLTGTHAALAGLPVRPLPLTPSRSPFELVLTVAEEPAGLAFSLQYNAELFDPATAEAMLANLQELLADLIADPHRPLPSRPRVTRREERAMAGWNQTVRDHDAMPWIHEAFRARAGEHPDDVALRFGGQPTTYGELDRRVSGLARVLHDRGIGPGSIVGVAIERSPDLVLALLGTLAAGAAYLPLEPDYPAERIRFMIEDARPAVVLTHSRLLPRLAEVAGAAVPVICLDRQDTAVSARPGPVPADVRPRTAAYVIYTSGSTGRPKGAVISHEALRNRIGWMQSAFGLTRTDRVLQKTPSSFDVSVWEFFWPLTAGACLVLADPGGHRDLEYLVGVIRAEQITTIHFVPSVLRLFLAEPGAAQCESLRRMFCSGEALPADLAGAVTSRLSCELYNLYGPTEATVDVTWWACRPGETAVPIGVPVDNTSIQLLDEAGRQVPVGAIGEISIGGVQVALGYLNRPRLTAERFVPDPFSARPGARLYRTGDLGRRRRDGAVEFLGRIDHQVKLHGNRVEIGEIEAVLAAHPQLREAVVTVASRAGSDFLEAHAVPAGRPWPEPAELISYLRRFLPAFMIPARVRLLERLPLTPSGKTDRLALGNGQDAAGRPADRAWRRERGPDEATVAGLAAEVLATADLGADDDFFALGGDSMTALRLRALLQEHGLEISVPELMRAPSLAAMAHAARRLTVSAAAPALAQAPPGRDAGRGPGGAASCLPGQVRDGLIDLARGTGVPLRSVLLAAHLKVVGVLAGRGSVTTGIIRSGAPRAGEGAAGPRCPVPLRADVTAASWRELARRAFAAERGVLARQPRPPAEIVRASGGRQPLDAAFSYADGRLSGPGAGRAGGEQPGQPGPDDPALPFTASFYLDPLTRELTCTVCGDAAARDPGQARRIGSYHATALAIMARDPDGPADVDLRPDDERRLVSSVNATARAWPASWLAGVHRRVADQARQHPAAVAVRCVGRELSYAELDARAVALAERLREQDAGPGALVAVAVQQPPDLAVAALGALRASMAFAPVSRSWPAPRLRGVLAEWRPPVIVTDDSSLLRSVTSAAVVQIGDETGACAPSPLPPSSADPASLACVAYSPARDLAGAEITHGALDDAVHAARDRLSWQDHDEVLLIVPGRATAPAGLAMFLPLTTGARLEIAAQAQAGDPDELARLIGAAGVTTMLAGPDTWQMLVSAGWPGDPALRIVSAGGVLADALQEELIGRGRALWSVYGGAETAIWAAAARLTRAARAPLGVPMANMTCHVRAPGGRPAPIGVPGELLIGGRGLARGYRGRPDLTAASFVTAPLIAPGHLWRTGRIAWRRPDGEIEFADTPEGSAAT